MSVLTPEIATAIPASAARVVRAAEGRDWSVGVDFEAAGTGRTVDAWVITLGAETAGGTVDMTLEWERTARGYRYLPRESSGTVDGRTMGDMRIPAVTGLIDSAVVVDVEECDECGCETSDDATAAGRLAPLVCIEHAVTVRHFDPKNGWGTAMTRNYDLAGWSEGNTSYVRPTSTDGQMERRAYYVAGPVMDGQEALTMATVVPAAVHPAARGSVDLPARPAIVETVGNFEVFTSPDGRLRYTLPTLPDDYPHRENHDKFRAVMLANVAAQEKGAAAWKPARYAAPKIRLPKSADAPQWRPAAFGIGDWVEWTEDGQTFTACVWSPAQGANNWFLTNDRSAVTGEYWVLNRYKRNMSAKEYTYTVNGHTARSLAGVAPAQIAFEEMPEVPGAKIPDAPISYADWVPPKGSALAMVQPAIELTVESGYHGEATGSFLTAGTPVFTVVADGIPFTIKMDRDDKTGAETFEPMILDGSSQIVALHRQESRAHAIQSCERYARSAESEAFNSLYVRRNSMASGFIKVTFKGMGTCYSCQTDDVPLCEYEREADRGREWLKGGSGSCVSCVSGRLDFEYGYSAHTSIAAQRALRRRASYVPERAVDAEVPPAAEPAAAEPAAEPAVPEPAVPERAAAERAVDAEVPPAAEPAAAEPAVPERAVDAEVPPAAEPAAAEPAVPERARAGVPSPGRGRRAVAAAVEMVGARGSAVQCALLGRCGRWRGRDNSRVDMTSTCGRHGACECRLIARLDRGASKARLRPRRLWGPHRVVRTLRCCRWPRGPGGRSLTEVGVSRRHGVTAPWLGLPADNKGAPTLAGGRPFAAQRGSVGGLPLRQAGPVAALQCGGGLLRDREDAVQESKGLRAGGLLFVFVAAVREGAHQQGAGATHCGALAFGEVADAGLAGVSVRGGPCRFQGADGLSVEDRVIAAGGVGGHVHGVQEEHRLRDGDVGQGGAVEDGEDV
ncbi:hypothetical protein ABZX88_34495 [Kitasatospora aureofaciens]|uniref:hypothetical protein n=1 Tax=Kitasatospora aureofaciens TaxID=1894 RepID=UPI0033BF1CB3